MLIILVFALQLSNIRINFYNDSNRHLHELNIFKGFYYFFIYRCI